MQSANGSTREILGSICDLTKQQFLVELLDNMPLGFPVHFAHRIPYKHILSLQFADLFAQATDLTISKCP